MQRVTHSLTQGSEPWHQHRVSHFNGSDASAMMGASKYRTRSALIREKATGITEEVSEAQQRLFDRGHAAEAAIRPVIEQMIGEDLYPVTMSLVVDGLPLSASLDGQTLLGETLFECKLWNEKLAEQVRAGELDPHYYWQMEQQLLVSGADRVIFATGDGEDRLETMEYRAVPGRSEALVAAWKQFASDVAAYIPEAGAIPTEAGRAPGQLPALRVEVTGMVTASNLAEFKSQALAVLGGINRTLQTDEDFANAEQTVKWAKDVEDRLAATKDHVLSQTADIELVFRTMDEVSAEARRIRLELDRLVKAEKENRKFEIVKRACDAYATHEDGLKAETKGAWISLPVPDFAGAIKGKRTLSSMQDAVDTVLANAKIAANESAKHIRAALACLTEETEGHKHLLPDYLTFIGKPVEDIRALVRGRIAEHQQREAEKLEAERERIRKEEVAKIEREQAEASAKAAREQAAEASRLAEEAKPAVVAEPAQAATRPAAVLASPAPVAVPPAPTGARIRLGDISARIAPLSITADGLAQLGFQPVGTERAAKLYAAHDFPAICQALIGVLQRATQAEAA